MVEAPDCHYCRRWHAEVGQAYPNSPEGKFAPLRRVNIGAPELSHLTSLRYTPTFVLLQGRQEIGRIVGYPGASFFWEVLAGLLAKTAFANQLVEDIRT